MQIERLATAAPGAAAFGSSGHVIYTATEPTLVSVIAANKSSDDASVYVYVIPDGASSVEASWGIIVYNLLLTPRNSYETFRFALNADDDLYVAGSASVAYYVQGAKQGLG